jgi:hypothetical protein
MLETFFDYNFEQGNAAHRFTVAEVFPGSTLDT